MSNRSDAIELFGASNDLVSAMLRPAPAWLAEQDPVGDDA